MISLFINFSIWLLIISCGSILLSLVIFFWRARIGTSSFICIILFLSRWSFLPKTGTTTLATTTFIRFNIVFILWLVWWFKMWCLFFLSVLEWNSLTTQWSCWASLTSFEYWRRRRLSLWIWLFSFSQSWGLFRNIKSISINFLGLFWWSSWIVSRWRWSFWNPTRFYRFFVRSFTFTRFWRIHTRSFRILNLSLGIKMRDLSWRIRMIWWRSSVWFCSWLFQCWWCPSIWFRGWWFFQSWWCSMIWFSGWLFQRWFQISMIWFTMRFFDILIILRRCIFKFYNGDIWYNFMLFIIIFFISYSLNSRRRCRQKFLFQLFCWSLMKNFDFWFTFAVLKSTTQSS